MGLFSWLLNIGTVFRANCPKCGKVTQWPACPNCGGNRFSLNGYGHFHCTNCQKGYKSMTCYECECVIHGKLFSRVT